MEILSAIFVLAALCWPAFAYFSLIGFRKGGRIGESINIIGWMCFVFVIIDIWNTAIESASTPVSWAYRSGGSLLFWCVALAAYEVITARARLKINEKKSNEKPD